MEFMCGILLATLCFVSGKIISDSCRHDEGIIVRCKCVGSEVRLINFK